MNLQLEDVIEKTGLSDDAFFKIAYKHFHGFEKDVTLDVLRYQVGGIVPEYVQQFLGEGDGKY
jgi:hypothetical protein